MRHSIHGFEPFASAKQKILDLIAGFDPELLPEALMELKRRIEKFQANDPDSVFALIADLPPLPPNYNILQYSFEQAVNLLQFTALRLSNIALQEEPLVNNTVLGMIHWRLFKAAMALKYLPWIIQHHFNLAVQYESIEALRCLQNFYRHGYRPFSIVASSTKVADIEQQLEALLREQSFEEEPVNESSFQMS